MASRDRTPSEASPGGRGALAFGAVGGVFAWIVHLGGSYTLVPAVCASGRTSLLHVLTLATALVAAGATWTAWRAWRGTGGEGARSAGAEVLGRESRSAVDPDTARPVRRFLALFGLLVSGFFLLLILGEGLPAVLLEDPCAAIPTADQPIVRAPSAGTTVPGQPVVRAPSAELDGPWPS